MTTPKKPARARGARAAAGAAPPPLRLDTSPATRPDNPPATLEDAAFDTSADAELERVKAGLGGANASAQIYRYDQQSGRTDFICRIDAAQISQEFLQTEFGGGMYNVRFRKATGEWASPGQFKISIDRRIPPRLPDWLVNGKPVTSSSAAVAAPIASAPVDDPSRDLYRQQILDMVRDSNDMRQRNNEASNAMFAAVTATIKSMNDSTIALVQSVAKGNQVAPTDRNKELLELVTLMDKIRPTPITAPEKAEEGTALDRALATLRQLRKLRDASDDLDLPGLESAAEPTGDSSLIELAKMFLPVLAGALTQEQRQHRVAPAAAPIAPAAAPAAAPPARTTSGGPAGFDQAPPPPPRGGGPGGFAPIAPPASAPAAPPAPTDPMQMAMTIAITTLFERAQEGDAPAEAALDLYNMCPSMYVDQLREAVTRPDAIEQLLTIVPDFAQHRAWLEDVVTALRAQFVDDAAGGK